MANSSQYRIEGSYYEACNCDAICPCRRQDGVAGGNSTFGICDFLLSWDIKHGDAGGVDLSGCQVCLAGTYSDDVAGRPWTAFIYVDEKATDQQFDALADIYQGKLGGNMNFTGEIATLLGVRRARIELDHTPGAQHIRLAGLGEARVDHEVEFDGVVSCGIPGHDRPGRENVSSIDFKDGPFDWHYEARCGFSTNFGYAS